MAILILMPQNNLWSQSDSMGEFPVKVELLKVHFRLECSSIRWMNSPLILQLKKLNSDLKQAEIVGLLWLVLNDEALTNSTLVRKSGIPGSTIKRFLSSISNMLDDSAGEFLKFNPKGQELIATIPLKEYKWRIIEYKNNELAEKHAKLRHRVSMQPKRDLDQFFATAQTSISKAQLVDDKGMLEGKKVALLGDDDLVSLAIPLLNPGYLKITVFDLDDSVLRAVEKIAHEENFQNIETVKYDVRKEIPQNYLNAFDVVLTDPPYTRAGIELFLNRALELLSKHVHNSGKYVFLCHGGGLANPEKTTKVQQSILDRNLLIEDKIAKFNVYYGAESVGSSSDMYVLKTTLNTNPVESYLENRIYTYEALKDEKFPFVDHYVFKAYGVPKALISSKNRLSSGLGEFCKRHKLKVVDTKITKFKPFGLSITYILSNSNLLVHTWPEFGSLHIDLVTCSPVFDSESLVQNIVELFNADFVEVKRVE